MEILLLGLLKGHIDGCLVSFLCRIEHKKKRISTGIRPTADILR